MKKLLTGLLVVGMLVGLVGCQKKPQEPEYDYYFMNYIDYEFVGPSEFADLKISLKEFTSKDFETDADFIKVKKYMNELFPYIVASKTTNIANADKITIGISDKFEGIDSDVKMDLTPYEFEVSNLEVAKYLDLTSEDIVVFYGLGGTNKVLPEFKKDCPLPQEVQDNLIYDITIDNSKATPFISVMSIDISLNPEFLQETKYSTMEDYFKSLGYIVDSHAEMTLKDGATESYLTAKYDEDAMKEWLDNKLKEEGNIDNYQFVSTINFQKTKTPFVYQIVAKYQSGDKVAYVVYEAELVRLLRDPIRVLSWNKIKTIGEDQIHNVLEGNSMVYDYSYRDFTIIEETPAEEPQE